jgi:hypothetical protein
LKVTLRLLDIPQAHHAMRALWESMIPFLRDGKRLQIEVKPETRSLEQNARMWAMLSEVGAQVTWYSKKLTPEDWKHVFSSSLRKLDVVPNLDGTGFVALGLSTSQMTKSEMTDMIEAIYAFGAERGVRFTAPEEVPA